MPENWYDEWFPLDEETLPRLHALLVRDDPAPVWGRTDIALHLEPLGNCEEDEDGVIHYLNIHAEMVSKNE